MPKPRGLSVHAQLNSWLDQFPQDQRRDQLASCDLGNLHTMMEDKGEEDNSVQISLSSPGTQARLLKIAINVDQTWVEMAKWTVDPERDWLPELKTRAQVVEAFRPFMRRVGGPSQIERMFFGGIQIRGYFGHGDPRLPRIGPLTDMIRFLVDNCREGGVRERWTARTLHYLEAIWEVFGRDQNPLPELTGDEEFNAWFESHVPHARVDFVADKLNKVVGAQEFSAPLLINWRRGSVPSGSKLELLLKGVKNAFPEWIGETPVRVDAVREEPPVKESTTSQPSSTHTQGAGQMLVELARILRPSPEEQDARKKHNEALAVARRLEEQLAAKLEKRVKALLALAGQLEGVVMPSLPPETPPNEDALVSGAQPVGETLNGLRFLLTAETFQPVTGGFTADEVQDTERLLLELARRLALMNSMKDHKKKRHLHQMANAFNTLGAHLRSMVLEEGDLPAMFKDMELVAKLQGTVDELSKR